jgi:hypothetical protein
MKIFYSLAFREGKKEEKNLDFSPEKFFDMITRVTFHAVSVMSALLFLTTLINAMNAIR